MSFYGNSFLYSPLGVYDTFVSSNFGLTIASLDSNGITNSNQGSEISPIVKKLIRNPKEYVYGFEQSPVLEFDFTITSELSLSAQDRDYIASKLFGQQQVGKLQIVQDDLTSIHYEGIFTKSETIFIGNVQQGWKCHFRSFSPFAYGEQITVTKSYYDVVSDTINVMNLSRNAYYTYPLLTFTMNSYGGDILIQNNSEDSRQFIFTGLSAYEVITTDNERQILTTSTGLKRVEKFNLKWLRLIPGLNELYFLGNIANFTLSYIPFNKVGG
jgi:hypothetical protein